MAGLNRTRKQMADPAQVEAVRGHFLQWGMHPVTVEQIPDVSTELFRLPVSG